MLSVKIKHSHFIVHLCLTLLFFYSTPTQAQSYGLGFLSHDVVQDQRTSLDLFPDNAWCSSDDFELSFDMSFLPGFKSYFGYILRIIKDDKENIDLIHEQRLAVRQLFKVVIGDNLSGIAFDLDNKKLFNSWNTFRLKFDVKNDRLILFNGKDSLIQNKIGLNGKHCFSICFGTNLYKQFKLTDVPPMKIRNVKLSENGRLHFHWPLDEREGLVAHEIIRHADGAVINPEWIKNGHYAWKLEKEFHVKGNASIAFNPEKGDLFIAGTDSLLIWSLANAQMTSQGYRSGPLPLVNGNQSLYIPIENSLLISQQQMTALDLTNETWQKATSLGPINEFWHYNKFFSAWDTSICFIGGYAHYLYKNSIFKYHIPSGTWEQLPVSGDHLVPRYLAALGTNGNGDSAWLLGGYGSLTGEQILKPQSLYDMMLFDVKHKTLQKRFELKPGQGDFVFGNSLVLDEKANTYYGLIYPNYKYNSQILLIKGSLSNAAYTIVGDTIPYAFHDISSYADLYFYPRENKFLTVTLLLDSAGKTTVNVYSLAGPPVAREDTYPSSATKSPLTTRLLLIAAMLLTGITAWYFGRRRRATKAFPQPANSPSAVHLPIAAVFATQNPLPVQTGQSGNISPVSPAAGSTILLFGEMQVFDNEGIDITRQFTPLLKELFLIILLYSIRKGRGVSSDQLNEILWSDKSAQSARNNRSVNIGKLKAILDKLGHSQISKETGYWKIDMDDDHIRVDYRDYLAIVNDKQHVNKQKINELANITQRGSFLSNTEYEWLDDFKSEVSNEIIDTYLHFAHTIPIPDDPEFLVRLANDIFHFDPVHETAITLKCKALAHLGKHSLAKNAFDGFTRQYKSIYGEDFEKTLQSILES